MQLSVAVTCLGNPEIDVSAADGNYLRMIEVSRIMTVVLALTNRYHFTHTCVVIQTGDGAGYFLLFPLDEP